MFSLIITIISIALVAALALATLYYGGAAFNRGHADAQAAKVRNQGQQLLGANELFKINHGRYALNVAELVSSDYLKSAPVARAAVQAALADSTWFMPLPGESLFLLDTDFPEACRSINEEGYGKRAILRGVVARIQIQCYGPSTASLYSMAAKDPKAVQALVDADEADVVGPAPLPTLIAEVPSDATSPYWSSPPGDDGSNDNSGGSSGTGGDNGNGGTPGIGVLAPYSSSLSFGTTTAGVAVTQAVSFQNNGGAALVLSALNFSSPEFSAATNTCTGTLAAGASCSLTVQYAPTEAGSHVGEMTLVGDGDSSTISLAGQANPAAVGVLDLTSTPAGFPGVQVGQTGTQTITVANTGTAAFSFTTPPAISGGSGKFTLDSTCGGSLAAGQECTLTVTFAPTDTAPVAGYLNFDTDVSTPTSLSLTGTGVAAPVGVLSIGAAPSAFTAQVGYTSAAQSVTLQNTGSASFTFTSAPTVTGSSTFAATNTCGATLAAGASCAVSVTFSPTNTAPQTGAIAFDTDVSSPTSIAISGTGSQYPELPEGASIVNIPTWTATQSGTGTSFTFPATTVAVLSMGYQRSWSNAASACSALNTGAQSGWGLGGVSGHLEGMRRAGLLPTLSGGSTRIWSTSTATGSTGSHWYLNAATAAGSTPSGGFSPYMYKDRGDSELMQVVCVRAL